MEDTKLTINLNLAYESLSTPQKIIIPIDEGKFGIWSYKQHKTDPLSMKNIEIGYVGEDRIKISARLIGRVDINNFPDLRVGGTKVQVEAGLAIEAGELCIIHPEIITLDLPNVPNFADKIIRDELNKNLLPELTKDIKIDIQSILEDTRRQLNRPIPFDIRLNHEKANYALNLNLEPIEPEFGIKPEGIHLKLLMRFNPNVTLIPPAIV